CDAAEREQTCPRERHLVSRRRSWAFATTSPVLARYSSPAMVAWSGKEHGRAVDHLRPSGLSAPSAFSGKRRSSARSAWSGAQTTTSSQAGRGQPKRKENPRSRSDDS